MHAARHSPTSPRRSGSGPSGRPRWSRSPTPRPATSRRSLLAEELDAIDRACSRFRDDSELARVNASPGEWHAVSPLFLAALDVALAAARSDRRRRRPDDRARAARPRLRPRLRERRRRRRAAARPGRARPPAGARVEVDPRRARVRRAPRASSSTSARPPRRSPPIAPPCASRPQTGAGVIVNLGGDCSIAGPPPAGGWTIRVTDRTTRPRRPGHDDRAHHRRPRDVGH